jgi:hypothetical protein
MSNLIPRLGDTLDSLRASARGQVPREVVRQVQREMGHGLVVGARLEAAAHTTRTALVNVALLSQEEEQCIRLAPLGEARYKAIVDAYAIYAAGEIGRF